MSSPSDYWGDEDLNSAVLNELAVIEATQVASTSRPAVRRSPPRTMPPNQDSDDVFDLTFDVDVQDLRELDAAIENDYRRKGAAPTAKSPSSNTFGRSLSGRQTTLFGDVISPRSSPKKPSSSRRGAQQGSPEKSADRKVKKWDHTAFAKTGAKRKRKARELDEDAEEDAVEFEQFPAPFVAGELVNRVSRKRLLIPSQCSRVSHAHDPNSLTLMVHVPYKFQTSELSVNYLGISSSTPLSASAHETAARPLGGKALDLPPE